MAEFTKEGTFKIKGRATVYILSQMAVSTMANGWMALSMVTGNLLMRMAMYTLVILKMIKSMVKV